MVAAREPDLSPAAALVRRHDPDRFLICLFVPAARREAAFTLAAFNHELARAVEVTSRRATGSDESRMTAAIRLQWWRDVLDGRKQRHDVATPLAALVDAGALDPAPLQAMIEAREAELEGPAPDLDAWWARFELGPGRLAVAIAGLCGLREGALDWCATAGAAYGAGAALLHREALRKVGREALPAGTEDGEASLLAHDVLGRLDLLPTFDAPRQERAAALHAVLARRDLRRVAAGRPAAPGRRRPPADMLAVAVRWWSGSIR